MSFCDDYPELCGAVSVEVQEAYGRQVTPADYGLDVTEHGEEGVSMTKQSMRDEVDVNNIVARYHDTGMIPAVQDLGVFYDVSEYGDFRTVLERVGEVEKVFGQLPAHIRAEFENDAANFIDFMSDDANLPRAKELGLVPKDPVKAGPVDQVPGPGIQGRDPVTGQFTSPGS